MSDGEEDIDVDGECNVKIVVAYLFCWIVNVFANTTSYF